MQTWARFALQCFSFISWNFYESNSIKVNFVTSACDGCMGPSPLWRGDITQKGPHLTSSPPGSNMGAWEVGLQSTATLSLYKFPAWPSLNREPTVFSNRLPVSNRNEETFLFWLIVHTHCTLSFLQFSFPIYPCTLQAGKMFYQEDQ